MNHEETEKDIKPNNYTVTIPKGSQIKTPDDEEDFGEWINTLVEFISSPEFAEKILPAFGAHLQRKHDEVMQRIAKDFKDMENKSKHNFHFLIARVFVGLVLVGAVTILTVYGKIATETTIVTMMVTLGFIIWGNRD